jgi:DNA-binding response OmpR family regulator
MARLFYDSTLTLVYDPVSANRTATRAALFTLGFRTIETVQTLDAFVEAMRRRPPDLALCEAQGNDEALCAAIQSIRQDTAGFNPFIAIIVTAWEKGAGLVNRVVNSGADDLLLRPFSTALLGQRIDTLVERRKGFVVTTDYIGPDRRRDAARPSNAELFYPPNSLRMKAFDRMSNEDTALRMDAELREACRTLTIEKLKRDAFQIAILWKLMQDELPGTETYREQLRRAAQIANGVRRRAADTEFSKSTEWCASILAGVEGLERGVDRNASMHLLGHAAISLCRLFQPHRAADEILAEVETTAAAILARNTGVSGAPIVAAAV